MNFIFLLSTWQSFEAYIHQHITSSCSQFLFVVLIVVNSSYQVLCIVLCLQESYQVLIHRWPRNFKKNWNQSGSIPLLFHSITNFAHSCIQVFTWSIRPYIVVSRMQDTSNDSTSEGSIFNSPLIKPILILV